MKIVVLGDVVRSRKIADRRKFGTRLRQLLARVEQREASPLSTPFSVTGIDSFVAVADRSEGILPCVFAILLGIRPEKVRLVVSRGTIDVGARSRDASRSDGPAFHRASEAIERIEKESSRLGFAGFGPALDDSLNAAGALLSVVLDSWTERQAEVIDQIHQTGSRKSAAEALAISPQAVSNVVRKTHYVEIERALQRIESAMSTPARTANPRRRNP